MLRWFTKVLVRVLLAIMAALICIPLLSLIGIPTHSTLWVGSIGACAALAATFAEDILGFLSTKTNQSK